MSELFTFWQFNIATQKTSCWMVYRISRNIIYTWAIFTSKLWNYQRLQHVQNLCTPVAALCNAMPIHITGNGQAGQTQCVLRATTSVSRFCKRTQGANLARWKAVGRVSTGAIFSSTWALMTKTIDRPDIPSIIYRSIDVPVIEGSPLVLKVSVTQFLWRKHHWEVTQNADGRNAKLRDIQEAQISNGLRWTVFQSWHVITVLLGGNWMMRMTILNWSYPIVWVSYDSLFNHHSSTSRAFEHGSISLRPYPTWPASWTRPQQTSPHGKQRC